MKKKEQFISELNDQIETLHREKDQMSKEIDYLNSELVIKGDNGAALLQEIEGLKRNITSLTNEH